MNQKNLFYIWGGSFIVCAGLGFIPEPAGVLGYLLTALSVLFFLPPAVLVWKGSRDTVKLVRNLSAMSLGLTVLLLVVNFLCAMGPAFLGNLLHGILVIVSAPMIASGNWALSLFLWACLLIFSMNRLKQM